VNVLATARVLPDEEAAMWTVPSVPIQDPWANVPVVAPWFVAAATGAVLAGLAFTLVRAATGRRPGRRGVPGVRRLHGVRAA
jgi:hypothetical protein